MGRIKTYVSTDGQVWCAKAAPSTWAAARDETGTTDVSVLAADRNFVQVNYEITRGGDNYLVQRAYFSFDTSQIKSIPKNASLNLSGYHDKQLDLIVVKASAPGIGVALTTNDYDAIVGLSAGNTMAGNVTDYSSEFTMTSWVSTGYNTISLNAAARSDMASQDRLQIAVISYDYDYLNVAPPEGSMIRTGMQFQPTGGTVADPYIEYPDKALWISPDDTIPEHPPSSTDFVSNKYKKLSREYTKNTSQIPFSKGIKGPANLRGRNTAYTATKG